MNTRVGYDEDKINAVKDLLLARQYTLSVAESVTAGHLQAAFSLAVDAMQFFQGGITVYNLEQKVRFFDVDPVHAKACDCVSGEIAEILAAGVAGIFQTSWGIGVTGFANPVADNEKDELFAFCAISKQGKTVKAFRMTAMPAPQPEVQVYYTNEIIKTLLEVLKDDQRAD